MKRTPLKRKTRLRSRSKHYRDIPASVRRVVVERANGRCENGMCPKWASELHHRLARSQGGPHTPQNLRALCWQCHQWTKINPRAAMSVGLVLDRAKAREEGIVK